MDGRRGEVTHGGEFWGLPVTLVPWDDVLIYMEYLAGVDRCCTAFCVTGRPGAGFYAVDMGGDCGDGEFKGLRSIGAANQA